MRRLLALFTFITLLGLLNIASASPIDDSTALLAGKNFLISRVKTTSFANCQLSLAYKAMDSSGTNVLFYVFNSTHPQGFVIVSGIDNVDPILGYSDVANFTTEDNPIQMTEWLEGYKRTIKYTIKNNLKNAKTFAQWESLISGSTNKKIATFGVSTFGTTVVAPLLKTTWNQSKYYNNLCPYDNTSSKYTYTGCVATVMAQIMKYWKYPKKGIGLRTYTPKTNPQYGVQSVNFSNTTYLWDSMPTSLSASSTANQINAVANLLYSCGVSVNMDYSTTNSTAFTTGGLYYQSADYALPTYFGYDNNIQALQRSDFTNAKWIDTLQKELKAGRPIIYRGTGTGGGHSFIADGFDNNNYIHINWGWGGVNDGYYSIDTLNPASIGIGGGTGGYNSSQYAIIGIKPRTDTIYSIGLNANLSVSSSSIAFNGAFGVSVSLTNIGTNTFTGDYAVAAFDASNNFVSFVNKISNTTLKAGTSTATLSFSTTGLLSLLPGTYELAVYYKPSGGNWTLVNNYGTYNNFTFISVNKVIPKTTNVSFSSCKSIVYKSKTYTSSTTVVDTLKAVQGWDSLYIVATITIKPITPVSKSVAYSNCNSFIYKSVTYTKSTIVRDTVKSVQGCDSIYNVATITINPITPITNSIAYSSCNAFTYKLVTYTKTTVIRDTIKSVQGCDSIYNVATITINPITPITKSMAYSSCNVFTYKSVTYTKTTVVRDTIKSVQGCDSIYNVATITINSITPITKSVTYSGCGLFVYKSVTYTKTTVVRDTVKSVQGCDSIYNVATITINIPVTPSISITASKTTIMDGDSITFVTAVANGGIAPVYKWTKNGVIISGATAATYTTKTLSSNDTIACQLTSNITCVTSPIALSNKVTVKVLKVLSITGNLITPNNYSVPKALVSLNSSTALFSGNYNFKVASESNYVIRPSKNNDSLKANGVSVIDLYLIKAHILGKTLLTNPYKIIAADVNNDGTVSVSDILLLKKLILGMDTTFTGNRLWAFVDSAYRFTDSLNPFPYKDSISFYNLLTNQTKQTFIGIKLGDVNYDWQSNISSFKSIQNKSLKLYYSKNVTENEYSNEVRVPIKVNNFKNLIGLQFTLNYNSQRLRFVGVEKNSIGIDYGTAQKEKGKISFLWNDRNLQPQSLEESSTLMELVFVSSYIGNVDSLSISSDITPMEAWDANFEKHDVELKIINSTIAQSPISAESWTIVPNPSNGYLKINLLLKEDKNIKFTLTTIEGRQLALKSVAAKKGVYTLSLNLNEPTKLISGLYYLKISGMGKNETKKVVVVNE